VAGLVNETSEGPGAALKSAREELGVSVREVAEALNLPVQILEAMEANDFEHLPQLVFTRGYLRSYARLLELDPDAIVARLPQLPEEETSLTDEFEAIAPKRISLPGVPVWILAAAGLGIVLLLWLLLSWLWSGEEAAVPAPTDSGSAAEVVDSSQLQGQPATGIVPATDTEARGDSFDAQSNAADIPAQDQLEVTEPDSVEPDPLEAAELPAAQPEAIDSIGSSAGIEAPIAEPAATIPSPSESAATPAGFRRITAFGDDLLELSFVDDCWVEVKDLDGRLLYGDLNRAGSSLKLIGRAPFRLLLGYAPGVEMTFNNEEIDLVPSIRNNVANVTVGR